MREFDNKYRERFGGLLCGVDEAGRGPLAGPVVAAAVMFDGETEIEGINDSKKLTSAVRDKMFELINEKALCVSYSLQSHTDIDEKNILQATLAAMKNSVESLPVQPDIVLIDGNKKFMTSLITETVVKGDAKSFSIAAASIIAKVVRDRVMNELADEFPEYEWHQNKGYPTVSHIKAVIRHGPSPYHRKSFLKNLPQWEADELYR